MGRIAYLLPGQGAQSVGMGKAFYDQFDVSRTIYKQANNRLSFDLAALCFEGPQEALIKTERCQLALFVTSLAALAAVRQTAPSLQPVGAAGLSLGELTALAAAYAFTLNDGLYLVQARGELMAECAAQQDGAMLAVVGLTKDAIDGVCRQSGAWAANYNAADQIVLSGTVEAIEKAQGLANAAGAKRAMRLEVAAAFHSPLMQPAADKFNAVLSKVTFQTPRMPVISNVTAQPVTSAEEIPELLARQIVSPVLWEPSMRVLIEQGVTQFIEFPPARVLTGLLRRIGSAVTCLALNDPSDLDKIGDAA